LKVNVFSSIRWRILIPFTVITMLSFIGLGIYLSEISFRTQLGSLETRLTENGQIISDILAAHLMEDPQKGDFSEQARRFASITGARVTIIDSEGVVLGESDLDAAEMENHLNRPEIQEAISEGAGSSQRYSETVKFEMLYVAVPISVGGEQLGFSRLALPLEEIIESRNALRQTIFIASLATGGIAAALGFIIATLGTKPIRDLTQEAEKMAELAQISSLPIKYGQEVRQLTRAFNTLVEKLQFQIQSLRNERSTSNAILRQMTDGVLITDENGNVILMNRASKVMFPPSEESSPKPSLASVIRQHELIEIWRQCANTDKVHSTTIELPRSGMLINSIAIPLGGDLPGHVLMLFQDLTQIRKLETIRRDFISNISHELRTPLASLKALTETLAAGALEDPPAARRFLYRMETEVDALTQMVSELLELSRIESDQVPLKLKPVSPKKLLVKARERLGAQAERKGLEIKIEYQKKLPKVLADKTRLGQVLVNLIHNAIKFTPEGGKVTLSASQDQDMIHFSVSDTGIGIPAEDLDRIFERFYKTDPARTGAGTGLGLAIARHLVESHDGRIWAENCPGQGSTITFSIPALPVKN
jgi:two-component system phosphate regulon sensor histidine kinase PhoR